MASEIRANAREALRGKWGKAALLTLTYAIIVFVINFVCRLIPIVGGLLLLVISTPISFGLIVSFMRLKRGEEVGYTDFLNSGFTSFSKVWGVVGNTVLKMILPICLLVIFIILFVISIGGSLASRNYCRFFCRSSRFWIFRLYKPYRLYCIFNLCYC